MDNVKGESLSVDPVMRAITGKKTQGKQAASGNTMRRSDTLSRVTGGISVSVCGILTKTSW